MAGQGDRHDYEADPGADLDRDVSEQAQAFAIARAFGQKERQAQNESGQQGDDRARESEQG